MNTLRRLDYDVSKKIAEFLPYDSKARLFFQLITATGTAVPWFVIPAILYFTLPSFKQEAYSIFAITAISTSLVYLLKLLFKRPRPDFRDARYGTVSFDIYSMPSGHAARAAYVSILMPMYLPELAILWYAWSLLMIVSRLVIGVHYISDILVGVIVGSLLTYSLILIGWMPYFPMI